QLEDGHSGRLERTEDLWLKVRKDHAPRLARLSLESRSLQDVLLHGKPKLGRELGRGQYGVVYLCDSWGGHFPCALKSVVPPDEKHWNDLALEFHYMRSLQSHERLVHLHGSVIDYGYGGGSSIAVLLIMERLHRDLYTGLKAGLELEPRLQIALDVVEGIRYLHSQGLVHRDIKLKNVLLDKRNRAKITDLGFCKPEAMMSGSIVGTPIHMAPELFTGKYDNSVDVYAFGILFWYLCSGHVKLPEAFERCASKDHLWNNVRRGVRPERLPVFDEECWQLMEACWDGDSSQRPLLGIVQPMLQGIMDRLCRAGSQHPSKGLDDST
ncbi:DUSTY kinase, partial [Picathartes gymnocephalus]|nr:DUSTY kinase [Picathartes gymnocephalus]